MTRHQNVLTMFLASEFTRGIHPLNVRHFEYFHGLMPPISVMAGNMATELQRL
jgi:hypothetical protein